MTGIELITLALTEIRAARAGDALEPESVDLARLWLNIILGAWNATRRAVYADSYADYTLTPALNPHTIGPTGTWTVSTGRPVSVAAMSVTPGSSIYYPINLDHDAAWYANLSNPTMTAAQPTDGYYAAGMPNGSLYLYPVPSSAYSVRVWTRAVLGSLANADLGNEFTLAQGYDAALIYTLAEALFTPFGQPVNPKTVELARSYRANIFGNNDVTPYLTTDAPSSGAGASGGGYDLSRFKRGF